jgi:hypothetical protein
MDDPIEIFFSYAHEDEDLMNDVRRQLIVAERNKRIIKWYDRQITPGGDWRGQIDSRLKSATIVLLFVSPHFIESKYCYELEAAEALRRHEAGEARVIPIILRPCLWEDSPFGKLQALPRDAKPVSLWPNRDEACLDVARGVMAAVEVITQRGHRADPVAPSPTLVPSSPETPLSKESRIKAAPSILYCSRCGHLAGWRSTCTGIYEQHAFVKGSSQDYCSRCGASPGPATTCTGIYTHHAFAAGPKPAHCSRCGAPAGERSTCVGIHTDHDFVSDDDITS